MKVQSIAEPNQPSFNARLSAKSLSLLSKEVESTASGNKRLCSILDRLDEIGNRHTVLDFGPLYSQNKTYYYPGSAAYDYMDEATHEYTQYNFLVRLTNHLFPNASDAFEVDAEYNDTILSYLSRLLLRSDEYYKNEFAKDIEGSEVKVFKNYIDDLKKLNPLVLATEETSKLIDVIKGGFKPLQAKMMVESAVIKDEQVLNENLKTVSDEIDSLNKKKTELEEKHQTMHSLHSDMMAKLNNEETTERQSILNKYI